MLLLLTTLKLEDQFLEWRSCKGDWSLASAAASLHPPDGIIFKDMIDHINTKGKEVLDHQLITIPVKAVQMRPHLQVQ